MQCRLEEEIEEGEVKVQWFINDTELVESDQVSYTFDGTYAKLFIANCTMDHTGAYKCVFTNEAGSDETTGKVTVKPAPVVKKTEKEPTPEKDKPKAAPYRVTRKESRAPVPEPGEPEVKPEEGFKLRKKSSGPRKQLPKPEEAQPAFA